MLHYHQVASEVVNKHTPYGAEFFTNLCQGYPAPSPRHIKTSSNVRNWLSSSATPATEIPERSGNTTDSNLQGCRAPYWHHSANGQFAGTGYASCGVYHTFALPQLMERKLSYQDDTRSKRRLISILHNIFRLVTHSSTSRSFGVYLPCLSCSLNAPSVLLLCAENANN